jgi:hypothetical protein
MIGPSLHHRPSALDHGDPIVGRLDAAQRMHERGFGDSAQNASVDAPGAERRAPAVRRALSSVMGAARPGKARAAPETGWNERGISHAVTLAREARPAATGR